MSRSMFNMRSPLFAGAVALLGLTACSAVVIPHGQVSVSSNWFSAGFLQEAAKEKIGKNIVVSPLSAYIVLSLAAYGAKGNTAKQMSTALRLPYNRAMGLASFKRLFNEVEKVDKVTLEVANRIYIAKNMKVREEFKRLAIDPFRTEAAEMDVTSPKETVKMINDWVAEKTRQKIKDLMQEDDIRADTRMTLLNAIYFKANWYTAFNEKDTRDETFHLGETSEVKVPMMQVTVNTYHGELPRMKAKFIELPYENENVVMIVILPDEVSGLSEIEKHLHSLYPKTLSEARDFKEVQVSLPKFKIESTVDLKRVVQRLGMTDMFTDRANFTGIALEPLKVDKVVQKAFIEVNEKGSEAGAATKVNIVTKSAKISPVLDKVSFVVDRPFYYMIRTPEVILFQGHVMNPTAN